MLYKNYISIAVSLSLTCGLVLFPLPSYGSDNQVQVSKSQQFTLFPVGINLNGKNVNTSALIKGVENDRPLAFKQWIVPFDVVVETLNITVTSLKNGKLELRSPGLAVRVDPQQLTEDRDLGLGFTIAQIEAILGVPVKFNFLEYALDFASPWQNITPNNSAVELSVDTQGLTQVNPNRFSFTTVGQRFRLNNQDLGDSDFDSRSDINAIGTLWGGSWYAEIDQSNLFDLESWQLGELQYLRQTDSFDYALGSQSTFWQNDRQGQYWGLTSIGRSGFTPENRHYSNGFSPNLRRQPQAIDRSIAGIAQPGDVVHLVTDRRQEIVQEVIVDATGSYQFQGVDFRQLDYQILIYPNGRLTAVPEVRELIVTSVSGQLSQDTSTLTSSLGLRRNFSEDNFWGEFNDLAGGVNYRRGVSEQLTLGTGLVVDRSLFAMGELFYQPNNTPLQLGLSALINPQFEDFDYSAYFNYQPTEKLNLNFSGNSSSHNLGLNWRTLPNLSLRFGTDNRDDLTTGFTFNTSGSLSTVEAGNRSKNYSLLTSLDYGNNEGLTQRLDARYNALQLAHQGDDNATFSRLSYSLANDFYNPRGHSLFTGYDTRSSSGSNSVINFGWHYRSPQNASDGGSMWDVELGYGFNSQGSAPIAALNTRIIPGTTIRLSYEGISPTDDKQQFRLDVFPNLRLQGRPRLGDRRMEELRTRGGVLVRPFGDRNLNGKLDRGEAVNTEDAEILLVVNHKSVESMPKEITSTGVYVPLNSGEYRLDLDPAGYPIDMQPVESSYAVKVTAGSYTELDIPFNPSYTAIGVVTDRQGEPVAGARVKAVSRQSDRPILSVTNSAGVYFLEGLSQDTYDLTVNDRPLDLEPLKITPDSETLQEINIQIPD